MTSKTISNFDAYAYSVLVRKVVIEGEEFFHGTVTELPDVASYEKTFEEAYSLAIDAIQALHDAAIEDGRPFPLPLPESESMAYSGRITLRMPRWLHAQLDRQAKDEGISLNQYLISILSAAGSIHAVVSEAADKICGNFASGAATLLPGGLFGLAGGTFLPGNPVSTGVLQSLISIGTYDNKGTANWWKAEAKPMLSLEKDLQVFSIPGNC